MTVLDRLAGALDRRDEAPNVELAQDIVARNDMEAILELAGAVRSGPARQANDALTRMAEECDEHALILAPLEPATARN